MKIQLHKNLDDRVMGITGKRLENITILYDDIFIADKDSCIAIGVGQYNVKVELKYTDGTIDILEDQELRVPDKGAKITINYKGAKDTLLSAIQEPLFWLGVLLSIIGIGYLIFIYVFYYADKSKYYEKHGSSVIALRNR